MLRDAATERSVARADRLSTQVASPRSLRSDEARDVHVHVDADAMRAFLREWKSRDCVGDPPAGLRVMSQCARGADVPAETKAWRAMLAQGAHGGLRAPRPNPSIHSVRRWELIIDDAADELARLDQAISVKERVRALFKPAHHFVGCRLQSLGSNAAALHPSL